ncbi:MAG: NAD(+) diphosphatase [Paracoccaceae bacterium]
MTDQTPSRPAPPLPYALGFAGGGLARHAERRSAAAALAARPDATGLVMWRGRPLVTGPADAPGLAWRPMSAQLPGAGDGTRIYLGDNGDGPLFALDISDWSPTAPWPPIPARAAPAKTSRRRPTSRAPTPTPGSPTCAPSPPASTRSTPRSPPPPRRCSNGTVPTASARLRRGLRACRRRLAAALPACGRAHFPRTDPVVIMLVTRGNQLLLGRSPGWPEGFYSLLAGFMEPGETVEAAVRREVAEETGVACGPVRLLNSQPWPFPASLMIGCIAQATSTAITLDPAELDDALWVSREELLAIFAGTHPTITAPRHGAIAGHLMHLWLADRLD